MRTKALSPALILLLAFGVVGALPPGSARADTVTTLPIASFYQVVADTAHGHLFISQGSSSVSDILVTDLSGREVATITGQDGVTGIALSPDGATLYAALGSAHAVTAIDTTTLKQTATYPLGNANTPVDVAVQSGKVWVSYDTGTAGRSAIGDIDLSSATPAFHAQAAMGGWYAAPELAADPRDTGVLVAAAPGLSPAAVASYDTSVDPVTVRAQSGFFQNCENEEDLAVAPGGNEFVLACGWPYAHYRYLTADLSQHGSYASNHYPTAVAIDGRGDVAAGIANNLTTVPDVYVYQQDASTPLSNWNPASSGGKLAARGLAWAPDGSALFAVIADGAGAYSLHVIQWPTLTASALSMTGPSASYIGRQVTLTGRLTLAKGAPPAGTPVTIARSVRGGTGFRKFAVTTAANGAFALADTPPALGTYIYAASYGGNATTAPATATWAVTVTRMPATLTLATGPATRTYEPVLHVTAHLGATYANRTVSVYAQWLGGTARKLLTSGKVDSRGDVTLTYRAPHSTTFSAVFSGDAHYAPKTVTRTVYVLARLSQTLSGSYGSRLVGGTSYRLYHRTAVLRDHAVVAPDKAGQCLKFEVQEYYRGAWRANVTTGCQRLSSASRAAVGFLLTHADLGYRYRIRADYVRALQDTSNLSNDSGWRYLIVTR